MVGSAAGKVIVRISLSLDIFNMRATSSSSSSTPRTPPIVLMRTGQRPT